MLRGERRLASVASRAAWLLGARLSDVMDLETVPAALTALGPSGWHQPLPPCKRIVLAELRSQFGVQAVLSILHFS
jgi:hypothetical protein